MPKDRKKWAKRVVRSPERVIDSPVKLVDEYLSCTNSQKEKVLKLLLRAKDR